MTPDGEQKGRDDGGPQQHAQDPWEGIHQGGVALVVEVGLQTRAPLIESFGELGFLLGDGAWNRWRQQARDGGGLQPQLDF